MDVYGHINNVRFLTYYEEARVELMFVGARAAGVTTLEEVSGILRRSGFELESICHSDESAGTAFFRKDGPLSDVTDGDLSGSGVSQLAVVAASAPTKPRRWTTTSSKILVPVKPTLVLIGMSAKTG